MCRSLESVSLVYEVSAWSDALHKRLTTRQILLENLIDDPSFVFTGAEGKPIWLVSPCLGIC